MLSIYIRIHRVEDRTDFEITLSNLLNIYIAKFRPVTPQINSDFVRIKYYYFRAYLSGQFILNNLANKIN